MPTLAQLRARINGICQDASPSILSLIDSYINEGLDIAAGEVLLPVLESKGQLVTNPDTIAVSIPEDWEYDRNIYFAGSITHKTPLKVFSSINLLRRHFPEFEIEETTGKVQAVTRRGDEIVYHPKPVTPETLVFGFYKKPTPLVEDDDIPGCLPNHFHHSILTHFACKEIFSMIEDGIDGVQVNTTLHKSKFYKAIEDLKEYFREGQSRSRPITKSDWF